MLYLKAEELHLVHPTKFCTRQQFKYEQCISAGRISSKRNILTRTILILDFIFLLSTFVTVRNHLTHCLVMPNPAAATHTKATYHSLGLWNHTYCQRTTMHPTVRPP